MMMVREQPTTPADPRRQGSSAVRYANGRALLIRAAGAGCSRPNQTSRCPISSGSRYVEIARPWPDRVRTSGSADTRRTIRCRTSRPSALIYARRYYPQTLQAMLEWHQRKTGTAGLPLRLVSHILCQLAGALVHLHDRHVAHNDVKVDRAVDERG